MTKYRLIVNMKFCEEQKIVIILAITAIAIILCILVFLGGLIDIIILLSLITIIIACSVPSMLFLFPIIHKKHENKLRKLNNEVLKKWMKVSLTFDRFNVEVTLQDKIDTDLFRRGKDFLSSENDQTRQVLKIWNHLKTSEVEYNKLSKEVRVRISKNLSKSYPSLKGLKEGFEKPFDNCYFEDNILSFVVEKLIQFFLEDKPIDWKKIRLKQSYYGDTKIPMYVLIGYPSTLIQSSNIEDTDMKSFQNVMEKLTLRVTQDLKELQELHESIEGDIKKFKKVMNSLSNSISLRVG